MAASAAAARAGHGMLQRLTSQGVRRLPVPASYRWIIAGKLGDSLQAPLPPAQERGREVARMASGFQMYVDLRESYERRMYFSGHYAPHLTRLVKRFLAPGDTFVDGGANIGYFSLLAAKRVGKQGSVHAFEPIPQTFQALQENIHLNGFTQICANCQALSEKAGELCFELPVDAASGNGLGRLATVVPLGRGPAVTVAAGTLDAYADQANLSFIKFIKLDLEGSEVAAIKGMRTLLNEHRIGYLVCELNTVLLDALAIPHATMRLMLQEYGYRSYYISPRLRGYLNLIDTSLMDKPDRYGDYLFLAPTMPIPEQRI